MIIVGVDLAGKDHNPSGVAILNEKKVSCYTVNTDNEIIGLISKVTPDLIALDAPLGYPMEGGYREADYELREFRKFPITSAGMKYLVDRGINIANRLKNMGFTVVEVFPEATKSMLGFPIDTLETQKKLVSVGFYGDVNNRILRKDEIDALFAAITGQLHLKRLTKKLGNMREGQIVVPKV